MAVRKRKEHSVEKRSAIVTWRRVGRSLGEIAKIEKVSKSTVQSILKQHRKNPTTSLASKKRPEHPPKISDREERSLIRAALVDPRLTTPALCTSSKTGRQKISKPTAIKILKKYGLTRRKAYKKPYLSKEHKEQRYK
jgi:transposase